MRSRSLMAALAMATGLIAAPAMAQTIDVQPNPNGPPTYGDVELSAGFEPDPYEVRIQAGGPIDGSALEEGPCPGYFAAAPDINFIYEAGELPLYVYIDADADTTLRVYSPGERWSCDDDSGNGLNAALLFLTPQSGTYHIWVGTYRAGVVHPASIMFSETGVD